MLCFLPCPMSIGPKSGIPFPEEADAITHPALCGAAGGDLPKPRLPRKGIARISVPGLPREGLFASPHGKVLLGTWLAL
ncbi:hypothetical protein [Bosea sp. UNC402CLCol]|uniref:hypothetical protein n=1 Tax=Bosea sp. UNC402CLCol TaxID=1510531 RepID=UPI00056F4E7C|nr:hypothetical protein [Bosea sp. UNC402CLCol]